MIFAEQAVASSVKGRGRGELKVFSHFAIGGDVQEGAWLASVNDSVLIEQPAERDLSGEDFLAEGGGECGELDFDGPIFYGQPRVRLAEQDFAPIEVIGGEDLQWLEDDLCLVKGFEA